MPQRIITGPVVDSAGVGLASGELHITPVVPAGVATDGFVVQTHVHTIADGEVTAPVVVPGTYRIDLFDGDGDRLRSFTANVGDASLAPITLKEVWEERSTPVDLPPADLREGDSILRLSPGGGLCGQVLQQHGDKLRWGDMQCGGNGSGDMKAQLYDPSLRRTDVYNRANHTGTQPHTTVTGLGDAATKDVGSTNGTVAAGDHTHPSGTTSTAGFISVTDKIKLDGIQSGATANLSNEYLLDRAHHTGTQSYTTVTGLGDAATKNVGTGSGDVAAGSHTHSNATTSTSGFLSPADKTKLDGIATGATANATDADLRDRATHTGTQAISTVTNLQTTLDAKADLVGGKLSTSQLPAIAINDTFTVSSQAAMLALTAQRGDLAIRTDQSKTYVLADDDPTILANWVQLQSPAGGAVSSVNGMTGAVTLAASDVGAASDAAFTTHTSDTSNPHAVTAAQAGAVALTGNETVAGNKSFSGEILPGSNVRFYGSAAATTNTSNIYHQYASGIMTLRLWTIGNTIAKTNGFEVVNNDFGSQSTYIRGYILGKQVFQSHSAYSGANADNPDFWVKTRLYVEHSAMPDTQPNVLIRLKTGQTGDAIKVVDQSDALVWNIDSSARASFKKLNISTSNPPSSPTATGKAGDVTWDGSYLYVCTADNNWKKAALGTEFSQGGTVSPTGGVASPTEVVIWRAPYACTVKSVNGYRKDGSFAVVNARKTAPDGTQTKFLSSDLALPASGQWFTATAGTMTMAAGDTLEIMVVAASGSPSQIAIQVDFER